MNTHSSLQHGADSGSIEHIRLDAALERFQPQVECEMRRVLERADGNAALHPFYGQMAYHLGWVDEQLQPAQLPPGKLLRPALLLWACALASAATSADEVEREQCHQQALPVAAAVEFVHNFSLIHDDIEDRDEWRRRAGSRTRCGAGTYYRSNIDHPVCGQECADRPACARDTAARRRAAPDSVDGLGRGSGDQHR